MTSEWRGRERAVKRLTTAARQKEREKRLREGGREEPSSMSGEWGGWRKTCNTEEKKGQKVGEERKNEESQEMRGASEAQ